MRLRTLAVGKRATLAALMKLEHLVRRTPTTPGDLSGIKDFLFLQYEQPLGTAVHATPVFEALKRASPDAAISVACCGMALEVLRHNPFIDRLIVTPDPYRRLIAAATAIRRAWSPPAEGHACIVTTAGSTRSKIALLGLLGGKGIRVGHTLARPLYHQVVDYDPAASLIENNLRVVERLGRSYRHYEPRVFFGQRELITAHRLLACNGLDDGRPILVLITQTSRGQRKRWRDERFIAAVDHAVSNHGCHAVFVGTGEEASGIDQIRRGMKEASVSLAGKLDIPTLSAVLCLADMALSLDTGTMHVARAAGLPTIIIAPAWQPIIEWLPLNQDRFIILRGEDIPSAPADYFIDEVSVDQALVSLDRLWAKYPPSPDARSARIERSLTKSAEGCWPASSATGQLKAIP